MAEEYRNKSHEHETPVVEEGSVETKDRGMFDFLGKKEEEKPCQEEVIATQFEEKVQISEPEPKKEEEEKKHGLLEKLHRSGSSSSSSSSDEEEVGEGGEKKKKKKKKEKKHDQDTTVPVEKCDEVEGAPHQPEEKKGFFEKIKEKLPGQNKKTEDHVPTSHPPAECATTITTTATSEAPHHEEAKEKKGILEKIKEKLPGYHPKTEEEKEKERETH